MATSDIHLKLGDIKGESSDDKHKEEIDVHSFTWSVNNAGSMAHGGGGGTGKAAFTDIEFTHAVDKASTALWKACATGEHMKEGTLTATKSGKGNGGSGNCEVLETVRLQAAKVDFEYKPQKADGSLDAGSHFKYDIKANKEG